MKMSNILLPVISSEFVVKCAIKFWKSIILCPKIIFTGNGEEAVDLIKILHLR